MSDPKNSTMSIVVLIIGLALAIALVVNGKNLIDDSQVKYKESVVYSNGKPPLAPAYTLVKDGYAQALLYFTLALGVLLLGLLFPRLQMIGFGGISLTLRDLPAKVDKVARQINALQSVSAGAGGVRTKEAVLESTKIRDENWEHTKTGRQLQLHVLVTPPASNGNYQVTATARSAGKRPPLEDVVYFHLTGNFFNPDPIILAIDGQAVLTLDKVLGPFVLSATWDDETISIDLKDAFI